MRTPVSHPFVLLRLQADEACSAWQLTQTEGPHVIDGTLTFTERDEAVDFVKRNLGTHDCILIFRSGPVKAALMVAA